jgi:hypothetical protein
LILVSIRARTSSQIFVIDRLDTGEAAVMDFRPLRRPEFTRFLRWRHCQRLRDKAVTPFAMAKYQPKGVLARMDDLEISGFPQFFPQVWKTLGGNPNWSRSLRARIRVRQTAECSTRAFDRTAVRSVFACGQN